MGKSKYLWDGLRADDSRALEELYHLYFKDLYNYGQTMTGDIMLIEDAIQDTFLSIWNYRNRIATPSSEKAYILRTFRNQMINQLGTRSKITFTEDDLDFNFEVSFEKKIIENEEAGVTARKVNDAFSQLTSRQREIIYYRFFKGLSFEEIADIMNMQTRATYKLTARALASLRKIMDGVVLIFLFGL